MTLVALALALAAAAAPPADAAPPPARPAAGQLVPAEGEAAVRALFERERPALPLSPFRTPAGFTGQVEAAAAPQVSAVEGAEELTISLGTGQPLSCTLFPERIDAGATIWRVAESAKAKVKLLFARPLDVVGVGGSALVLAVLGYQLQLEKGPVAGQVKLAVYAHATRSLLCVHDEPGYVETFGRVVRGLAVSLAGGPPDERAGAAFAELSVIRVGGLAVGFAEHVVWERKGGGRVAEQWGAQILPRGPADLVAIDTSSREVLDAGDLLVEGVYAHSTNGELDTRIELARGEDGKTFRYGGEKDGKELRGTFATRAGLAADLWFARRLAKGAPPPKGELRHEAYSAQSNPVAATPVAYRPDAAAPRRATMELGAMRLSGELDDHGLFRAAEMPIGQTKLVVERLSSRGAP